MPLIQLPQVFSNLAQLLLLSLYNNPYTTSIKSNEPKYVGRTVIIERLSNM